MKFLREAVTTWEKQAGSAVSDRSWMDELDDSSRAMLESAIERYAPTVRIE